LSKWNFGARVGPYLDVFTEEPAYRQNRWELLTLAVDPAHQNKGLGQEMVAWGLQKAKEDGLPAVVIGAQGTERLYNRCGFVHTVGNVSQYEFDDDKDGAKVKRIDQKNPLNAAGIVGGTVMWTE
jgi:predicted N-acetyltransferase YhbS